MSFFKKFTTILPTARKIKPKPAGKAAPKIIKPPKRVEEAEIKIKANELIIEARDKAFQIRRQADSDAQKIIQQARFLREQVSKDTAEISRRLDAIARQKENIVAQEEQISQRLQNAEEIKRQQLAKLEKIAKLNQQQAHQQIIDIYQKRMTRDIAQIISDAEKEAKTTAEKKAKEILVEAMRHGAHDYVAEYTVSLVKITDEDIKGKIIGREGRNIRTFEKITGVETNLDEAGIIRLSSFDSVRREVARVALEKLIADGRIQPSRIENTVKRVSEDIQRIIRQEGEKLCHTIKVFNLPVDIVDMLGRFKYRFSYGQNLTSHVIETTKIGVKLAHEVGANVNVVKLGCLLHDIGKVINEEEGTHVEIGVKFLKRYRIPEAIINCVAEHHEDKPFSSIESVLVYIADAISAVRPGARYEDHEGYSERMTQLEEIAKSFAGVKKSYAIQAGREVRVIVDPQKIDDQSNIKLANDIRDKIQTEITNFPGTIKITVIREMRSEATTK